MAAMMGGEKGAVGVSAAAIPTAVFEVRLEKKGRGHSFSMVRPWAARLFKVSKQTLSYYDGSVLKGELSLRGATCKPLPAAAADGKPYAMELTTSGAASERIILNAPSEEVRNHCIEIFNSASLRINWTPPQKRVSQLALTTAFEKEEEEDGEEEGEGEEEARKSANRSEVGAVTQRDTVKSTKISSGGGSGGISGSSSSGSGGKEHYEGDSLNGVPHGRGKKTFKCGDVYEGEWFNGVPNGSGAMRWASGNKYEGAWLNGRCHGAGKLLATNGDRYEGSFVDDAMHGQGRYLHADGKEYVGAFEADKPHGQGVLSLPNGEGQLRGNFVEGALRGNAVYVGPDGKEKRMKMPES